MSVIWLMHLFKADNNYRPNHLSNLWTIVLCRAYINKWRRLIRNINKHGNAVQMRSRWPLFCYNHYFISAVQTCAQHRYVWMFFAILLISWFWRVVGQLVACGRTCSLVDIIFSSSTSQWISSCHSTNSMSIRRGLHVDVVWKWNYLVMWRIR